MRDKTVATLFLMLAVFVTAHNVDHVARGDLAVATVPFLIVVSVIYAVMALVYYFFRRGKIGARFFTFGALGGLAFGWLSHFSPYTDQPASYIVNAYASPVAGWLALSTLLGIVLVLSVLALYAGWHWWRGAR